VGATARVGEAVAADIAEGTGQAAGERAVSAFQQTIL